MDSEYDEIISFDLKSYEGDRSGNSFPWDDGGDDDETDGVDKEFVKNERKRNKKEKKLAKNGGSKSAAPALEGEKSVAQENNLVDSGIVIEPAQLAQPEDSAADAKKNAKDEAQKRRNEGHRRKQEIESGAVFVEPPISEFDKKENPKQRRLENRDEEQERLKRIEYYKERLLIDLNALYPLPGISFDQGVWNETKGRLRANGVEWLVMPNKKPEGRPVRRFKDGQRMAEGIREYLNMEAGEPKNWADIQRLLVESHINYVDLSESRKKKGLEKQLKKAELGQIEDNPMSKLARLATNKDRVPAWKKMLEELPTDLARYNANMMLEAAFECIGDFKRRKRSQGEWFETYVPLLEDLGISFER